MAKLLKQRVHIPPTSAFISKLEKTLYVNVGGQVGLALVAFLADEN
jgi:hypothetical protein